MNKFFQSIKRQVCKSSRMLNVGLVVSIISSASFADVVVDIDISEPAHHMANITIEFPATNQSTVDIKFPQWRTGKYEILNLSDVVRFFKVTVPSQSEVTWEKTDKGTWRVSGIKGKKIKVSYQVYANQLGKRSRHIDDSHAFIDASGFVMYSNESKNDKHIINLNVPDGWRSVSGMGFGNNEHQFIAESFDVLIDSPIETGVNELYKFSVDGRDYELVIWGKGNYDAEKMLDDLKVLVQQSDAIWEGYPFERYVFMVHATSGARGATEHLNSTIIQRSRYSFAERKDYLGFLATAAHEFVHTWNVKAYRPKGLAPYDYQQENYSNLIWLSEGSTSYLQYQLLTRGGLISAKELMDNLAKRIAAYLETPGTKVQSVAEGSFDTWMKSDSHFAKNHSVGIYAEGYMASWLLDYQILQDTHLEKSYKDVHNELYQNYKLPYGFTENDVQTVIQKVAGKNYADWWQANILSPMKPNFEQMLFQAGLEMVKGDKQKPWTGITAKRVESGMGINFVAKDSPAWKAGLTVGDVIIAINGLRLAGKDIEKRIKNFSIGENIELTYFRRDELQSSQLTLDAKPSKKLSIKAFKKPSKQQKMFFKAWLGMEHPSK